MGRDKWKESKKAIFLKQLGTLLEQGYTLSSAIELLSYHERKEVKELLKKVIIKLKEGASFYQSLQLLNIPSDILTFVFFSEKNGNFAAGIKHAGNMYLKKVEFRNKLNKVLRYPLFLLWLIFMIFLIMYKYLFPPFQDLFDTINGELPIITVILLGLIDFSPLIIVLALLLILVIYIYYVVRFKSFTPHKQISILMGIPFISSFLSLFITYYFCIQLSGLLRGGMSILDSLTVFEEQDNLPFFKEEAKQLKNGLLQGETLVDLIKGKTFYKEELPMVVTHGENKSQLDLELNNYSKLLLRALEEKIQKAIMLIQPILFFFIGMIVFVMFLSVFLPVFQLINAIE